MSNNSPVFIINRFKTIISRLGLLYIVTAMVLGLSLNRFQLQIAQMDDLQEFAQYPSDYLSRFTDFDTQKVRYARRYFEKFIKMIPQDRDGMINDPATLSRGYAMIAWCDYYLGRYPQAIAGYQKALQIEPRNIWIHYNLGVLYYLVGDDRRAVLSFRQCLFANENVLAQVMELDYWKLWPKHMAQKYRTVCFRQYRDMIMNAYLYSILANDRLQQRGEVKNLAIAGVKLGYGRKQPLLYAYAQDDYGVIKKPVMSKELMISPSQFFIKLGQEKYLIVR